MDNNDKTDIRGAPEVHVADGPSPRRREARLSARVCPNCGQPAAASQGFCPYCGVPLTAAPPAATVPPPAPSGVRGTSAQHLLLLAAVVVVVIAAVGAVIAFVLSAPSGFSGIRIVAPAGSCWAGAISGTGRMESVHGCGSQDYPLTCGGSIMGAVQKDDTGSWTLTVEILSRGRIVQQSSTSSPYGGVSVVGAC